MIDLSNGTLLAVIERDSCDPITGNEGKLIKSFYAIPIDKIAQKAIEESFGPSWRRYRPDPAYANVLQYNRRGDLEDPFCYELANTFDEACEHIDILQASHRQTYAHETVLKIQRAREEAAKRQALADEAERQAAIEAANRDDLCKRSETAFIRVRDSGKPEDARLCQFWHQAALYFQNICARDGIDTVRERYAALQRVNDDLFNTVTMPTKRKALRAAEKAIRAALPIEAIDAIDQAVSSALQQQEEEMTHDHE